MKSKTYINKIRLKLNEIISKIDEIEDVYDEEYKKQLELTVTKICNTYRLNEANVIKTCVPKNKKKEKRKILNEIKNNLELNRPIYKKVKIDNEIYFVEKIEFGPLFKYCEDSIIILGYYTQGEIYMFNR